MFLNLVVFVLDIFVGGVIITDKQLFYLLQQFGVLNVFSLLETRKNLYAIKIKNV